MKDLLKKVAIIKDFAIYLQNNVTSHSTTALSGENIEDIKNSIMFLQDYNEVADDLIKAIKEYSDKTGYEM